jgi:CheY-like chemotaxis protein
MEATEKSKVILHIDDDEDDRMLVKEAIRAFDSSIKVIEIDDGEKGLDYLMKAKNQEDKPCLVILDLNMPKMDGKLVLTEIKKDAQLSLIPIVIFTTSSSELDKTFARKQRVQMITKPPTSTRLTEAIAELITNCDGGEVMSSGMSDV